MYVPEDRITFIFGVHVSDNESYVLYVIYETVK